MLVIAVLVSGAASLEARAQSKSAPNTDRRGAPAVPASGVLAEAKNTPSGAPAPPTLSKTPLPFDEEVPPAGADNLMFSDGEIRYCLAQIIRIEAVRPLVNRYEKAQVGYFNELVADYNTRCGHYRYMEGARDSAQVQVEISRSTIESDARQAYLWRFVESESSSAPTRSPATAQTPAQAAKKPPRSAAAAQADAAASQPSRSGPPKQQAPARTEPAQAVAAQPRAKQPPSAPPAPPPATTQPERSAAPTSQAVAPQQAAPMPSESVQAAAAQPQAKPQPSESAASTPPASPPEASSARATQTEAQQAPAAIASALDTRAAEPSSSARAVDQAPSAPAPDTPAQANQPPASATQAQGKQQIQSSTAAAPASSQNDRPRDAAPAQQTKPTSVAKATTDSVPAGAVERFAREVERAGSQLLDQRDYPSEARDKKWEGTTLIEVRYAEGGYIRSIVVGQSCGHPVLDQQAVQIARNLRLPNAPEELRSREFAVRFPIVFQLSKP